MPYGEPQISDASSYTLLLESSLEIPDSAARISITLEPSEEGWTPAGLDALFQQFLDHLDAATFLAPVVGDPVLTGNKNQRVNTSATPTPAPGE